MESSDLADAFLKYDYAETKDLLKTFITLNSATLVLSLTFSDKIGGFSQAAAGIQNTLFVSWVLFILALIFAGLGMSFIAAAAGKIIYGSIPLMDLPYFKLALISWTFVLLAGGTFVGGLIALAVAAGRAITQGG